MRMPTHFRRIAESAVGTLYYTIYTIVIHYDVNNSCKRVELMSIIQYYNSLFVIIFY